MKRIYLAFTLLVSMTILVSHEDNPPNGKTGAPGDNLCTECHTLDGGTQNGSIFISGLPSVIEPATAYVLTVTNSNPNGIADIAGFQMTILNSNNQKAGTMSAPSANSVVTPSGGREYWEHNPAQLYDANNMYTWTVTWTSPTTPLNTTITAYAAGNVGNNNNDNDGDLIVTSTATGTLNSNVDPLVVEIVASTDVLCNGASTGSATAAASGGTPTYSYHWSNNVNNATINNVPAGTYTVTVTDNNGTTATNSVVITQPSALILQNPNISNVSCNGGSNGSITANVTGGVSPYNYDWSNGSSSTTISNLTAGSYTLTVTDDNGCTKMATYQVTQPQPLDINLVSLHHESCFGEEDGSITISVSGGVAPIFAEWSNGFIGTTITNLAPETYSVTVTDNNDCTETATYVINEGGVVVVTLQNIHHVSCNGGSDGSIAVSASGGQAPYTYAWSNGASGASVTNLAAGSYLVTASDNNGCSVVKVYNITQPAPITIQINATGQNLCAADSLVDLTAVATGDHPPFTGAWSNGVTGLTNNDLAAGTYMITVTDNSGCTATSSYTVTSPTTLSLTLVTTDETAPGANDGTSKANVSGGSPAYSYLWSNGATTDSIGGLAPGVYLVTVTDNNGCTAVGSGQVDAFGCALDVLLGPDVTICDGDTTIITPSVTGANGVVTYLWSNGSTSPSITVSEGGEYCVTVTDEVNCQDVDCIIIIRDTFPLIVCPVMDESAPGANDGAIICDNNPLVIAYAWSNGATTSSITGLAPGDYCVTMTLASGCSAVQCFTVNAGNCQLVITSIITDALCKNDTNGAISVTVENATPPVTFAWSTGDTTQTVSNLAAGPYSVTVADGAGCVEPQAYTVNEPSAVVISIDTIVDITELPGSVNITIGGGTEPYSASWQFPDGTNVDQEDLPELTVPGFYTVVVTDSHGCQNSATVMVDINLAVDPTQAVKSIKVYPVPAQEMVYIDLESQVTEAMILGIDGRLVKRILNPVSNVLQIGELESGLYFLQVSDGVSRYIARIVK